MITLARTRLIALLISFDIEKQTRKTMDNEVLKERYELALERISRLRKEIRDGESGIPEKFCPFCEKQAELLFMIKKVVDTP